MCPTAFKPRGQYQSSPNAMPRLAGDVKNAAQNDLSQFVTDRFQERGYTLGLHSLAVSLPVENQTVFCFQDAVVCRRRIIGRRSRILQHGHTLLNVHDGEQEIRGQQNRTSLVEAVLDDRTALGCLRAGLECRQRRSRHTSHHEAAEHVQGAAQSDVIG